MLSGVIERDQWRKWVNWKKVFILVINIAVYKKYQKQPFREVLWNNYSEKSSEIHSKMHCRWNPWLVKLQTVECQNFTETHQWKHQKRVYWEACQRWRWSFWSSHQRCSMKKAALRNFAKFTGKRLCQSLFFKKVADLRPSVIWCVFLWILWNF